MKSILTTLDVLSQQKAKSADIIAEDEIDEEFTLEEFEALEETEYKAGDVVYVNGRDLILDEYDDGIWWATDSDGGSHEFEPGTEDHHEPQSGPMGRQPGSYTDKEIKMAYGILNDPRYKGGNLTGAIEAIEKIAPGLSDYPSVKRAMLATSESVEEGWWPFGGKKEEKKGTTKPRKEEEGPGLFGGYKTRQEQLDAMEKAAMGEGHDMVPYADPELDFEGDMAKNQLARITMHSEHLASMLDDNENLPEWVQSKITKALDYIATAHDYLMGERRKD